ncbi:MAG: FliI/YscN family ATPase [Deltaproteobacteria bacterium]|nr:FliI/YscN family ATPase [Deltaproteobacteria bacterium]
MKPVVDFARLSRALEPVSTVRVEGRVCAITGLCMRATVPGARVGELVEIVRRGAEPLAAEVVGFDDEQVVLMPYGDPGGVGPGDPVRAEGRAFDVRSGPGLLGRVLDGLGSPIDGAGPLRDAEPWGVMRDPPEPLARRRITRSLPLGVRAIDALCTVAEGQRLGLFAGSGVGKSSLLGQIARSASSDVNVICLIGERGREVREFVEESLGPEGLPRSVVVCATSDAAALVRLKSAFLATAIAEWFRDRGQSVLLLMDSVTRFARAQREVGLAAGEPPTRRGYPPSVFSLLPRLLERSGNSARGSITAIYTVLVEGGDMDEPIADEVRGILDGHIVLARRIAERGQFPAIDVLASLSRVMDGVVTQDHRAAAARVRSLLAAYEQKRDLIVLGAYKKGSDQETDQAIAKIGAITSFLTQKRDEPAAFEETVRRLSQI